MLNVFNEAWIDSLKIDLLNHNDRPVRQMERILNNADDAKSTGSVDVESLSERSI